MMGEDEKKAETLLLHELIPSLAHAARPRLLLERVPVSSSTVSSAC